MGVFVFAAALLAVPAFASSATALAGQAVTFSVAAAGTAPFSYRWYKNGTLITSAISQSYRISSVKSTDAGTYTVVVANAAGSAVSDAAILAVVSTTTAAKPAASLAAPAGASVAPAAATPSAGGALSLGAAPAGAAPAGAGAGGSSLGAAGSPVGSAGTYSTWRRAGPDAGDWRAVSVTVGSDGETQIVWQNTVTGAGELWIMDGATLLEVIPLADLPVDAASTS